MKYEYGWNFQKQVGNRNVPKRRHLFDRPVNDLLELVGGLEDQLNILRVDILDTEQMFRAELRIAHGLFSLLFTGENAHLAPTLFSPFHFDIGLVHRVNHHPRIVRLDRHIAVESPVDKHQQFNFFRATIML